MSESEFDVRVENVPEGMNAFAIMGKSGDTKVIWDPTKPAEVAAARAQFESLTKDHKYSAFCVSGDEGKQGKRMSSFDPDAGRVILIPQVAGG